MHFWLIKVTSLLQANTIVAAIINANLTFFLYLSNLETVAANRFLSHMFYKHLCVNIVPQYLMTWFYKALIIFDSAKYKFNQKLIVVYLAFAQCHFSWRHNVSSDTASCNH